MVGEVKKIQVTSPSVIAIILEEARRGQDSSASQAIQRVFLEHRLMREYQRRIEAIHMVSESNHSMATG